MSSENVYSYLRHFLFTIVMATIPTTSKLSASTSSGTDEEHKVGYDVIINFLSCQLISIGWAVSRESIYIGTIM